MDGVYDTDNTKVPTLVFLCQRVAGNHADLICSLGNMSLDLVKPILEKCSVDQLLRLEEASPHLQAGTPVIWKTLCFQNYRMIAEVHYSVDDEPEEPDSWKSRYFFLQDAEARRIEEIGLKIRSQRLQADERKKEKEVRFTDRVPPPKRPRTSGWGVPSQPKTLFQKARGDASKMQKAFYSSRVLPPMPTGKTYRVSATANDSILPPLPKDLPSRVTVNTVTVHRPIRLPSSSSGLDRGSSSKSAASSSSSRTAMPSWSPSASSTAKSPTDSQPSSPQSTSPNSNTTSKDEITQVPPNPPSASSNAPPAKRPLKPPASQKKDPMASLFVPKHRAYSQRPVR